MYCFVLHILFAFCCFDMFTFLMPVESILCFLVFFFVSQIPQGQLHIAQVPQGEEVQITQDSEASDVYVWLPKRTSCVLNAKFKRTFNGLKTIFAQCPDVLCPKPDISAHTLSVKLTCQIKSESNTKQHCFIVNTFLWISRDCVKPQVFISIHTCIQYVKHAFLAYEFDMLPKSFSHFLFSFGKRQLLELYWVRVNRGQKGSKAFPAFCCCVQLFSLLSPSHCMVLFVIPNFKA